MARTRDPFGTRFHNCVRTGRTEVRTHTVLWFFTRGINHDRDLDLKKNVQAYGNSFHALTHHVLWFQLLVMCSYMPSLILSAKGAYVHLHSQTFTYVILDIIQITVASKTNEPHATPYSWQCRYNNIYAEVDLNMIVIKTLYITHHDNACDNQIRIILFCIKDGLWDLLLSQWILFRKKCIHDSLFPPQALRARLTRWNNRSRIRPA